MVFELAEHKSKKDWHIWVVVERHDGPFFDKEQYQSEVLRIFPCNSYSVQVAFKVEWVLIASATKHLRGHLCHLLHNALAHWVGDSAVKEGATAWGFLSLKCAIFDAFY